MHIILGLDYFLLSTAYHYDLHADNADAASLKTVCYQQCVATCNRFLACRIVVLGLIRLNIKARHDIPEFLNANLWSIHLITFKILIAVEIFSLHTIFADCPSSSLSTQKNWELRIWNLGQSYGWLVSNTVDDCLQRQIAQKVLQRQKWKLVLVTTWLPNIALYLLPIWLQTLGSIDSESRLTLFLARSHLKLLCL